MYDDDSLDSLNPSVTTESNSNEAYNQELSEQLGFPVTGGEKTLYSKEVPDPEAPPAPTLESAVEGETPRPSAPQPPSAPAPTDDGSVTFTKEEADELRAYIRDSDTRYRNLQQQYARDQQMALYRQQQAMQQAQAQQQPPKPQPDKPTLSEFDQARGNYMRYLTNLYGPAKANQILEQQDAYMKAYFKNSFDSSMSGYQNYFDREKERAYTEDLDNVAEGWVKTFSENGRYAGLTPHECRRVVFSNIKAYIDAGHKDIDDINNWVAHNSTTMLMAAADEKRKILLENARRQNASRNPNATTSQPPNSVPSTTAARNMVSTGEDARMRADAGVTGGSSSSLTPEQQVNQSTLDSLAKQTGLRFKM